MGKKKRNHYVPKFMLNRFATPGSRGNGTFLVTRYSIEHPPITLSTTDTGLKKYFYGRDGVLEDKFMPFEARYGAILKQVDRADDLTEYQADLSDLAWQLALRTKAFRDSASEAFSGALDEMAQAAKSPDASQRFKNELKRKLRAKIEDELSQLSVARRADWENSTDFKQKLRDADRLVEESVDSGIMSQMMADLIAHAQETIVTNDSLADSHNTAIAKAIEKGEGCPATMRPRHWIKLHSQDRKYVLGDAPAFAIDRTGQVASFVGGGDRLAIFLPIGPECCLMGYFDNDPPQISETDTINHAISVSKEAFFYDREDEELAEIGRQHLGRESNLLEQSDIMHIAQNAWID